MSGTAAVCSASVTSTYPRIDPHGWYLPGLEGLGHDAAACQLAHRHDLVVRSRGHVARGRQCAHRGRELREVLAQRCDKAPRCIARDERGRHADVTLEKLLQEPRRSVCVAQAGQACRFDQPVGDLGHGRHDHDRRRGRSGLRSSCPRTMAVTRFIASASATDVPPNFMMTFTAVPRDASARR